MTITTEMVKELRDQTAVSIMQCKKALEEAGGDMETARMILKKKSSEIALKKSEREVKDGRVSIATADGKAAMTLLLCETDFVSKNDDFVALAKSMTEAVLSEGVDAVRASAGDRMNDTIQKTGENIQFGDAALVTGTTIGTYIHGDKIGVLVSLSGGSVELANDLAMQICAMKPEYTRTSDIPADMAEKAKSLFVAEVEASDKPAEIKAKMLEGKVAAYFREITLMEQSFFKNPDITVANLLKQAGAELVEYARLSV
jgi:elongation factor Ts